MAKEYRKPMGRAGKIAEMLRALMVLALFCLNFSHVPLSAALADMPVLAAEAGFCGDPVDHRDSGYAPCHACRIGDGAVVPPACGGAEPAFGVVAVGHAALRQSIALSVARPGPGARAPPAA